MMLPEMRYLMRYRDHTRYHDSDDRSDPDSLRMWPVCPMNVGPVSNRVDFGVVTRADRTLGRGVDLFVWQRYSLNATP